MTLETSFACCKKITQRHARSFYFASHALPAEKRKAAYAIYALCRYIDDQIDLAPDTSSRREAIERLRLFLSRLLYSGGVLDESQFPWLQAFQQTIFQYQIPSAYFFDLLTGVEMDIGPVRFQTWDELHRYCYHVAGVVGLMMLKVFANGNEDLKAPALALGTAMQLTNILRDIAEDWQNNRLYLPEEEMRRFGVGEEDIARGRVSESFLALMRFQIGRARDYYQKAEVGIRALPRDGSQFTVRLMSAIYGGILDEIERADYQVFRGRVFVSTPRKTWLALKAWNFYRKS